MSDSIDVYIDQDSPAMIIEIADGPMGPPNDAVATLPPLVDLGGPTISTGA